MPPNRNILIEESRKERKSTTLAFQLLNTSHRTSEIFPNSLTVHADIWDAHCAKQMHPSFIPHYKICKIFSCSSSWKLSLDFEHPTWFYGPKSSWEVRHRVSWSDMPCPVSGQDKRGFFPSRKAELMPHSALILRASYLHYGQIFQLGTEWQTNKPKILIPFHSVWEGTNSEGKPYLDN